MTHAMLLAMWTAWFGLGGPPPAIGGCAEKVVVEKATRSVVTNTASRAAVAVWIQVQRDRVGKIPGEVYVQPADTATAIKSDTRTEIQMGETVAVHFVLEHGEHIVVAAHDGNLNYMVCF